MKNVFVTRAVWMAGISALALLSACGGGGSGSNSSDVPTGADALSVKTAAIWGGQSAVTAINLSRADGAQVEAGTVVSVSEWTCESSDPQGLNAPEVTSEVTSELVATAGASVTLSDLRLPATNLLVKVMSGTSTYYAKRHNMANAGNSNGSLAIVLNVAPDSEESMAAQFDKCP